MYLSIYNAYGNQYMILIENEGFLLITCKRPFKWQYMYILFS